MKTAGWLERNVAAVLGFAWNIFRDSGDGAIDGSGRTNASGVRHGTRSDLAPAWAPCGARREMKRAGAGGRDEEWDARSVMNIEDDLETPDRSLFLENGRVGVLLIHGLGGTPVELRFIAQGLARAGHTVYCCQLAGHCGTPEELRRSGWRDWYASVEEAHDKLSATLRRDPRRRPVDGRYPGAASGAEPARSACTASCSSPPR